MVGRHRWFPVVVVGSLFGLGCGGGDPGPTPPPPPPPSPANLIKQAGDNQTAEPGQSVSVAPAVRVTSSSGDPISGVAVTFAVASGGGSVSGGSQTTGSDGIATVGGWTLGDAVGPNTLTASITATGVTGNPATFTATGELAALNPTGNVTLSGNRRYTSIDVPAGVTVTMAGDLTLNATGNVTIAGTIAGDCKALTVNADGALTVSGTLDNGCAGGIPPTGPPTMTLVGKGGWTLDGGGVLAPGDVTVTDDPTATDADFAPSPFAGPPLSQRSMAAAVTPCVANNFTGTAKPATALPNDAANGVAGGDGTTWTLRCKNGPDIILNGLSLTGQHGGKGGDDTDDTDPAVADGGKGGSGGTVKIQAFRDITIGGGTIKTGDGGAGGSATATGVSEGGASGASATATGGAGGVPGLFGAFAKTGSINFTGAVTLEIGKGGAGGHAIAVGMKGHGGATGCPAATGGAGTATAGAGGSTPDKTLQAGGAVNGVANVTVLGGRPGEGGNAKATAGDGGAGDQPCKPGATGGAPTAKGGKGGDADLRDANGIRIALGADGGDMEVVAGKGGQGWIDCKLPIFEEGGKGGDGGMVGGSNGAPGSGLLTGIPGSATYRTVANGGNGGDGLPPGDSGKKGGNSVTLNGGVTPDVIAPSFTDGAKGKPCPSFTMAIAPTSTALAQGASGTVHVTVTRVGGFDGEVAIQVKDQDGNEVGTGTIPAGQTEADVSFTVPSGEQLGSRTYSVMGMGDGVPMQSVDLMLTVLAPSSIAIVSATPSNPTVVQGATASIDLGIVRSAFTGDVTVLLKDEADVSRGSATIPGPSGTTGTLNYGVPASEPTGTRNWTLVAMGSGVSDAMLPYPIVVDAPPPPATVDIDLNTMPRNGNLVPFGTHMLDIKVGNVLRGNVQVQTVFNSGNHFWSDIGAAGLRVGSGDGNGFRVRLNTATVDGARYFAVGFGYCLRNATGIDGTHPVVLNQRDVSDNIIQTDNVFSLPNGNAGPLCGWTTILPNAESFEILAPAGVGRFIDSGSWQIWAPPPPP